MNKIIVVSCLLLVVSLVGGCGERVETTEYFYSPTFTNDGKVLYVGLVESVTKNNLGSQLGSSSSQYVKTIYPTGTGESITLFDATAEIPYHLSCSPTRDYVAYLGALSNSRYGKIVIKSISTEAFTGLQDVELSFDPPIRSFDWTPDGNGFVYCTTNEVRIRAWNDYTGSSDTLITAESGLTFVSWQYGGRVAFVRTSGADTLLSLIYSDGSGRIDLTAAASVDLPQISAVNTNEVFGIAGGAYCSVDVSAVTPATVEVEPSFTGVLPRLSPDATMVTYSKSGETSGVYILYTATGTEEAIK
ncbi:MAG: hypothetical protein ABIE84_01060 [bacterium]